MLEIVAATRNPGKLSEIRSLLESPGLRVLSLDEVPCNPDWMESGGSYLENARIKALSARKASGKPALADDSGLEIDALDGAPGLYSSRFGGEGWSDRDRYERVLALLKSIPPFRRTARFRCVVSICMPDGREYNCEGVCEGSITEAPRGDKGFGYDPIFFVAEYGRTMAELDPRRKNRVSHRKKALRQALDILKRAGGKT